MAITLPTVLQVIPRLDTGGAELATLEINRALVKAGAGSLVATEGGRMAEEIAGSGGELVTFKAATKNPARALWNAKLLAGLIERRAISLVHARSRAPAWSAFLACRMTGTPFVTTFHGAYAEKGALKRFYNSVMARADVVIANSHYTAGLIRERYRTPEPRIKVIYRGIDEATFDPALVSDARVEALQAKLSIPAGHRIILQAARLTSWKGQSVVLAAAARLKAQGLLDVCAIVFAGDAQGRDGYVSGLKDQIADYGLGDIVRFAGHVTDMPAAYKLAHVAVVASTEPEAFGRAGAEAEAMGCPVVSTNHGAPPETILAPPRVPLEMATGWLVPPGDAAALATALAQALELEPAARLQMGLRARRHVREAFSLAAMQSQTLAVYDRLLHTQLEQRFRTLSPQSPPGIAAQM